MTKRKPKIIKDKKLRGEWAESVFMARAGEQGLAVSRPWGDSKSYDCVVGTPGKFVAVQVKSTVTKLRTGKGYICSVCSSHKAYEVGAFDFVAAYVVREDAWYIIPAGEIRGMLSVSLGNGGRFEVYREAWESLREASGMRAAVAEEVVEEPPTGVMARMQAAGNFVRRHLEGRDLAKR